LAGHTTVSNDLSPFAATVAAAKLNPPEIDAALSAVDWLQARISEVALSQEDFTDAQFGLNASVADYYHPETLAEVLKARKIYQEVGCSTQELTFMWASLLHILHGNRPYALSRTSHPITPLNPHGPATYKPLIDKLRERIRRALTTPLPASFRPGLGLRGDFRDLPTRLKSGVNAIITSPPFVGMRFDRPNWLRMWFMGWTADDFHKTSAGFLERQQLKSRDCYHDFFRIMRELLTDDGLLIVHVGSGGRGDLAGDFRRIATKYFQLVGDVHEDVQAIEHHGLRDRGLTTAHHLLFFEPATP
jgi:hypothetical protein